MLSGGVAAARILLCSYDGIFAALCLCGNDGALLRKAYGGDSSALRMP